MAKILALAVPELANGFRLAGIDTQTVRNEDETYQELFQSVHGQTHELIILPQEHFARLDERRRKEIDALTEEVVVPVPMVDLEHQPPPRTFVSDLVRRAIGFQIKV